MMNHEVLHTDASSTWVQQSGMIVYSPEAFPTISNTTYHGAWSKIPVPLPERKSATLLKYTQTQWMYCMRDGPEGRCRFSWNARHNMAKQRMGTHFIGVEEIMAQTETSGSLKHPFGTAHNTRAFPLFTMYHKAGHFSTAVLYRWTKFGLVVSDVGSILYLTSPSVSPAVDLEMRQARQISSLAFGQWLRFFTHFLFVLMLVGYRDVFFQRDSSHVQCVSMKNKTGK